MDLTIKAASINSPWAYIREGLLSEGYLRPRFGGLIFFFFGGGGGGGLLSEFYGIPLNEFQVKVKQKFRKVFKSTFFWSKGKSYGGQAKV